MHHIKKTTLLIIQTDKITWNTKTPVLLITQNDKMTWNKKTHHTSIKKTFLLFSLLFLVFWAMELFFSNLRRTQNTS